MTEQVSGISMPRDVVGALIGTILGLIALGGISPGAPGGDGRVPQGSARAATLDPAQDSQPAQGIPRIVLVRALERFGVHPKGEVFERSFPVQNLGRAPLEIRRVTSKCSCSKILEFPRTLAPGERGTIRLRVDTNRIATGVARKKINIFSNTPGRRRTFYHFIIDVREALRIEPEVPILTGLFTEPKELRVTVRSLPEFRARVVGASSRQGRFEVRPPDPETSPGAGWPSVLLRAPAVDAPQLANDELLLHAELPDGRELKLPIGVIVEHLDEVATRPARTLRFANKETDPLLDRSAPPAVKRVEVFTPSTETRFQVLAVRTEGFPEGAFDIAVGTLEAGRRYSISVSLSKYHKESYLRGKLIIETSSERVPVLTLDLQAMFGKRRT